MIFSVDLSNLKFILEIFVAVSAIISTLYAFYRFILKPKQEIKRLNKERDDIIADHKNELKQKEEENHKEIFRLRDELLKEKHEQAMISNGLHEAIAGKNRTINILEFDKKLLESNLASFRNSGVNRTEENLIQEEKVVYVKYLYITPAYLPPKYVKHVERINEDVEVYSEHLYYRFNKFNREDNQLLIKDTSSQGVVDLNIIYPWMGKIYATSKSDIKRGQVDKVLSGSRIYLSMTSYYNSFIEEEEDIGMRMEYDTKSAKLIVDFSSIPDHGKLFTSNPDGFIKKHEGDQNPISYMGLKPLRSGVYMLEHENLKADSKMELDFHVDWNYVK